MKLVVELADIRVPGVDVVPEPDQELGDGGQHVHTFGQNLVQAGHGRVDHQPHWGRHAIFFVDGPPGIVVVEGGLFDGCLFVGR